MYTGQGAKKRTEGCRGDRGLQRGQRTVQDAEALEGTEGQRGLRGGEDYSRREKLRAARKVQSANSIPSPLSHHKDRELQFGECLQGHMLVGGIKFHCPNTIGQSASSFCPETSFLRFVAARKTAPPPSWLKRRRPLQMKNLKYRCGQWLEKKPLKSLHVWDMENRRFAV